MRGGEGDPRDETWWATPPRFLCTTRIKKTHIWPSKGAFFCSPAGVPNRYCSRTQDLWSTLQTDFSVFHSLKTHRSQTILNHKMSQERQTPSPSLRHWKMTCWRLRIHQNPRMMRTSYTLSRRERRRIHIQNPCFPNAFYLDRGSKTIGRGSGECGPTCYLPAIRTKPGCRAARRAALTSRWFSPNVSVRSRFQACCLSIEIFLLKADASCSISSRRSSSSHWCKVFDLQRGAVKHLGVEKRANSMFSNVDLSFTP